MILALALSFFAGVALAGHVASTHLPMRYNGSVSGATFLYSSENGGHYVTVPIQALNEKLVLTNTYPNRVYPCLHEFGAQNFTLFYAGSNKNHAPTLYLVWYLLSLRSWH